jgi:hypothetical protein
MRGSKQDRKTASEARRAREAEALRANLRKRKAQARARKRPEVTANIEKKPDGNQS